MNRFQKAWLALVGKLEPEVREVPVPGEAVKADLYRVSVPDKDSAKIETFGGTIYYMNHEPFYFSTCEQAHTAHPGLMVERVQAILVGGKHFVGKVSPVIVQPKPKRAKGKRG